MNIKYICPNCDYKIELNEELLGKKVIKCPGCEATLEVHKENDEFKCLYLKKKKFKFTKEFLFKILIALGILAILVIFIIIFSKNSNSINNISGMYK